MSDWLIFYHAARTEYHRQRLAAAYIASRCMFFCFWYR
jgi:hypothetical protein